MNCKGSYRCNCYYIVYVNRKKCICYILYWGLGGVLCVPPSYREQFCHSVCFSLGTLCRYRRLAYHYLFYSNLPLSYFYVFLKLLIFVVFMYIYNIYYFCSVPSVCNNWKSKKWKKKMKCHCKICIGITIVYI